MSQTGSKQLIDSPATSTVGSKASAPRLCYVDDSRTSAYVVKRMLRPYGYTVDHYESAEPALVALVQGSYDLLLTDLKVSPDGMDGDDLVRALRNSGHGNISEIPIIVITGTSDAEILEQVYDAGANHILTKPVNGDELDAHIRKLVFTRNHAGHDSSAESELADAMVENLDEHDGIAGQEEDSIPVLETDAAVHSSSKKKAVKKPVPQGAGIDAHRQEKPEDRRNLAPGGESSFDATAVGGSDVMVQRPAAHARSAIKTKSVNLSARAAATKVVASRTSAVRSATANQVSAAARSVVRSSSLAEKQQMALTRARAASIAKQAIARQVASRTAQGPESAVANRLANRMASRTGTSAQVPPSVETNDKAEALRKVKAAIAAKKAKLAQQQKAVEAQLQREQIDKDNEVMAAIAAEAMGLDHQQNDNAPIEVPFLELELEPVAAAPSVAQSAPQAFAIPQEIRHEVVSNPQAAAPQAAIPTPQPVPPSQPQNAQPPNYSAHQSENRKVEDVLAAFQQTGRNQPNILTTMEQYPLVEADMSRNYSPSRMLRVVNSVLELYGPKRILTSVMLVGMVFVLYGAWSSIFDEGLPVDVTVVGQGEIYQSITVPGRVVSKLRVNMTPSIAGRITNVYVEEGDRVKTGDLLARLDDREAISYLKRATANLESAKEDVILAERSLTRLRQAFEKGAIARQLVEDAEVELRAATAHNEIAGEEVRTAKLSLENPRVVAPFAGTVTARFIEVGQWVVPSETLFSLVDEAQREIEVQVDAADSGGIAIGQTVNVSSDAFPGLDWSESVTRLAAATSNVGNANTVSVFVSLGNSAPSLRFGQQVDADIRTSWNPNALKVPYGAIVNRNGNAYVITIEDGRAQYVPVETGIEDFSHVEILQGVNIGQTVVLANGQDIDNGQRIFLAANTR